MPTEGTDGEVWSLTGSKESFMIRKIFFGLMVLENILQVALLNKDSAQILAAYRPGMKKKADHFPSATTIKPWLSNPHFHKYITPP